MPSDAKKREAQKKKDAAKARNKKPAAKDDSKTNGTTTNGKTEPLSAEEALCAKLESDARLNAEARACTGSLAVHPKSRDVKIANFSITFHGCEMLQDALLELNCGRRYGLLGLNGSGKQFNVAINKSKQNLCFNINL